MKPHGAEEIYPPSDLLESSLKDAFSRITKIQIATLRCHEKAFVETKQFLKHVGADTADNPLSPQINLLIDPAFTDEYEWSLELDGKIIWSPGAC